MFQATKACFLHCYYEVFSHCPASPPDQRHREQHSWQGEQNRQRHRVNIVLPASVGKALPGGQALCWARQLHL